MLDLAFYKQVYGLSCVENQVLAIMTEQGHEVSYYYADSTMPLKELFFYTMIENNRFAKQGIIERIQDRLKAMDIISLSLFKEPDETKITKLMNDPKDQRYILIEINSNFSKNILMNRGWRDDHYVLLEKQDEKLIIHNDKPSKSLILSAEHLHEIYNGTYFQLKINRTLSEKDKKQLWKLRKYKPEKFVPFHFYPYDLIGIENAFPRLREMVMIYKIIRYRLKLYYQNYVDTDFIDGYLAFVEKLQAEIEYSFIKKRTDIKQVFIFLTRLNDIDIKIMSNLKERIQSL